MVSAVSLFSGCGGSDAGLVQAGVDVLMANDVLSYAKEVYEENLPETDYRLGNVKNIEHFPDADLLVGCYPCQGFSQGGKRNPNDPKNLLYKEFSRALGQIRPKAFIVENVSGMARRNFRDLLDDQVNTFSNYGYKVHVNVLNASAYGVPQDRKRIFLVGIRSDIDFEFSFPEPTHGTEGGLELVTIRDAIGHLPEWPDGKYYDLDFHWYYLSRDRRRDWDQTSKTILANPRHMPLHPISPKLKKKEHNVWEFEIDAPARRFSYMESALLQGFPIDFSFPREDEVSLNMKYKVVGNAVPPALFNAIYKNVEPIF